MAAIACSLLQTARNAGLSWVRELARGENRGIAGPKVSGTARRSVEYPEAAATAFASVSGSGAAACTAAVTRGASAGEKFLDLKRMFHGGHLLAVSPAPEHGPEKACPRI